MTLIHKLVIAYYWRWAHTAIGLKPSWKELRHVFDLYETEGRHYHTLQHIYECLMFMRKMFPMERHPVVVMALIYHDCIYDVRSKVNEELSAEEFRRYASGFYSERFVTIGNDLILATKGHLPAERGMKQIMLDCDLHILAAPWPKYKSYAKGVWGEYSVFGKDGYIKGRTAFLEGAAETIRFSSPQMQAMNAIAQNNLKMELTWLRSAPDEFLNY